MGISNNSSGIIVTVGSPGGAAATDNNNEVIQMPAGAAAAVMAGAPGAKLRADGSWDYVAPSPGQQGFGVGVAPSLPAGMSELSGTGDVTSDFFGNYQHIDGSIMVWIPAFYYKIGTGSNGMALNDVSISPVSSFSDKASAAASGYALHRAFIDGGVDQPGVFVDKYQCSNNAGVASSIKNSPPLSTAAGNNPISALSNAPANNYGGALLAAKSRGAAFFCASRFIFSALSMLSLAHAQAATSATWCAWYDAAGITNYPKGNNNSALGDSNDATISFVFGGNATYPNAALCGSASVLAKATHNGQNCGVVDLNGNVWEVSPGITSDATNYFILNTSVRMRDMGGGNTLSTDLFGIPGLVNYTSLGTTYGQLWAMGANRTVGFGSPTAQALSEATSGNAWNATGAGIPLAGGGANAFGNDFLWDYKPNEMCPIAGGSWVDAGAAGVWALNLAGARAASNGNVGFRAALYL